MTNNTYFQKKNFKKKMKVIEKKIDCLKKLDETCAYNAGVVFEVFRFLGIFSIKKKMWVVSEYSRCLNKVIYYLTDCKHSKCKFETLSEAVKELDICIEYRLKEYANKKVVSKKTINFY